MTLLLIKKGSVLSRCPAPMSASSGAMKCIRRLLYADETRRAAAGRPTSLKLSHEYLLHGNNPPIVVPIHGTPLATNRRKYASALFFRAAVVGCSVYLSVFVSECVYVRERERKREKESSSTYFNLCDCKDTKKAIEGIKVLVIEPDWNLEH